MKKLALVLSGGGFKGASEFLNTNSILQQQGLNEITYEYFNWTTGTTTRMRRKRFNAIVIQPETTLGDTLYPRSYSIPPAGREDEGGEGDGGVCGEEERL